MLNTIRGIVSGKKQRYKEQGFDLDLVRITDRMIIMGYPATGLASLYRNKRSDVLRFLEPYAPHYKIYNLCPLYENSYDANEIVHEGIERETGEKTVQRFPWPDHHPPPLSLIRLAVENAKEWYQRDQAGADGEKNTIVIHCKAGKGRSGTFAVSVLLALPGLPSPPSSTSKHPLSSNSSPEEEDRPSSDSGTLERAEDSTDPVTTKDLSLPTPTQTDLSINEKLDWLLKFHTSRRMQPSVTKLGISISSQRRFLRYWARILDGKDPRSEGGKKRRMVKIEWVRVRGVGLPKGPKGRFLGVGNDKIAVQVWKYKDEITDNLRNRELSLLNSSSPSPSSSEEIDWNDSTSMFSHVGGLVESTPHPSSSSSSIPDSSRTNTSSSSSSNSSSSLPDELRGSNLTQYSSSASTVDPYPSPTTSSTPSQEEKKEILLLPSEELLLDGEREIMFKFLIGKTGKKHGKLPVMASLGLCWIVPVFESDPEERNGEDGEVKRLRFETKDLDFVKSFSGIQEVELAWKWV
ncbi:hypothetical protein JCM5353_001844 [Sporobolomyces roseus]